MSGASISSSAKNDGNIHSVYRQREKGQADKSPGPAPPEPPNELGVSHLLSFSCVLAKGNQSPSFAKPTLSPSSSLDRQASSQGRQSVCRSFKVFQLTEIESSGIGWMD